MSAVCFQLKRLFLSMFENSSPLLSPLGSHRLLQFAMNIVPLLGVIFMDWSVFALIYVFWLETLGMSFFNAIRIMFAQGTVIQGLHIRKALGYLLFRVFILCFYMLFILVFIGFMVSGKQGEGYEWVKYLMIIDPSFRIAIISFFFIKLIELIYFYFIKAERRTTDPEKLRSFFDLRILVIHAALVGGFFLFKFFHVEFGLRAGLIAFASIFTILKVFVDHFSSIPRFDQS
jgi:hypothetical protein